jgi:hypothetical protein
MASLLDRDRTVAPAGYKTVVDRDRDARALGRGRRDLGRSRRPGGGLLYGIVNTVDQAVKLFTGG